ncbi:MAG: hypothetical protein ACRCWY_05890 [Cellulosilyticaceae bacterium]
MKKTLTLLLAVGTLTLASMTVFAVEPATVSTGDGGAIELPKVETDYDTDNVDKEIFGKGYGRGCSLEDCDTYGECGDLENCENRPGEGRGQQDGLRQQNMMRTNAGQGNGARRSCCR